MAKKTESRCIVCGALVGPGVRFCCHYCKLINRNSERTTKPKRIRKKSSKKKKKSK